MQTEIVKLLLLPRGQETAGNTCCISSCLSALSLGVAGIREYAPKPAWIAAWISIRKWLSLLCLPDPASKQRHLRTPVSRLLGPEIQGRRWLEMKADERETVPNRVKKTSGKGSQGGEGRGDKRRKWSKSTNRIAFEDRIKSSSLASGLLNLTRSRELSGANGWCIRLTAREEFSYADKKMHWHHIYNINRDIKR